MSFSGDTIIALANGNRQSLSDLAEFSQGSRTIVVLCADWDDELEDWVDAEMEAVACQVTKDELFEVVLESGASFWCTDNQELAMSDGSYREASLCIGETMVGIDGDRHNVASLGHEADEGACYTLVVSDLHNFFICPNEDDTGTVLVHHQK